MKKYIACLCFTLSALFAESQHSYIKPQPIILGENESAFEGFGRVSYTYWQGREIGVAPFQGPERDLPTPTIEVEGKIYVPKVNPRSGFKLETGLFWKPKGWQIDVGYQWYRNMNRSWNTLSAPNGQLYLATFHLSAGGAAAAGTPNNRFKWYNWFQRVDTAFSAPLYDGHSFTLIPFVGITGAWDRQNLIIDDQSSAFSDLWVLQRWWGVGPKMGIHTQFVLYRPSYGQLSLLASADTGQLWDRSKVDQYRNDRNNAPKAQNTKGKVNNTSPFFDTSLGFSWSQDTSNAYVSTFEIRLLWELQTWLNHNRILPIRGPVYDYGPYSLQGLTLDVGIGF